MQWWNDDIDDGDYDDDGGGDDDDWHDINKFLSLNSNSSPLNQRYSNNLKKTQHRHHCAAQ